MDEKLMATYHVRDRPVGLFDRDGYLSLQATERGYFPVSHTGFRSLAGMAQSQVTAELMEGLAVQQDRERAALIRELREPPVVETDPVSSFIHVKSVADRALERGFFVPEADRRELWAGAFQMYSLIQNDGRFQPAPNDRWDEVHCQAAMEQVHEARRLVERCASGSMPMDFPIWCFTAKAYAELAETKPEPVIDLGREQLDLFGEVERPAVKIRVG